MVFHSQLGLSCSISMRFPFNRNHSWDGCLVPDVPDVPAPREIDIRYTIRGKWSSAEGEDVRVRVKWSYKRQAVLA
jgi:hypothetical protein